MTTMIIASLCDCLMYLHLVADYWMRGEAFVGVLLKIRFFWAVILCCQVSCF